MNFGLGIFQIKIPKINLKIIFGFKYLIKLCFERLLDKTGFYSYDTKEIRINKIIETLIIKNVYGK